MPIVIEHVSDDIEQADVDSLYTPDGNLTVEGQLIEDFLNWVDWSPIFEDAYFDAIKYRTTVPADAIDEDGEPAFWSLDENDDGDGLVTIESIVGEDLGDYIDEDDLFESFCYYIENLPEDTLEEKTRKAVGLAMVGLEESKRFGPRAVKEIIGGVTKVRPASAGPYPGKFKNLLRRKNQAPLAKRQLKAMYYKGVYDYRTRKDGNKRVAVVTYKSSGVPAAVKKYNKVKAMMRQSSSLRTARKLAGKDASGETKAKAVAGKATPKVKAVAGKATPKVKKTAVKPVKKVAKKGKSVRLAASVGGEGGAYAPSAGLTEGASLVAGVFAHRASQTVNLRIDENQ
mgnify:CR=1 FL=1